MEQCESSRVTLTKTFAKRDWAAIRADFPILEQTVNGHPLVYFDSAASSQKPREVIDALSRYYERDNANVHRGLHELSSRATEAYESARAKVATYLGAASAEEIVFTRGTTEAINLVAHAWGGKYTKAGDVILLTEMEHHSNLVPWQLLAARTGVQLRFVPLLEDGTLDLAALEKLLTPEVKLFAFTHISNSLGTMNPAAELCRRARALGVTTLVDGAQSAGHMPVNVREIGCDFYAFSGHKMCAPTGIGALYGPHGDPRIDAAVAWRRRDDRERLVRELHLQDSAPRFEAGTPNIAGAIGLGAAVDYLESIGRERILRHDQQLALKALEALQQLPGVRTFGPRKQRGGLVGFVAGWAHPHDLTTYANEYGIALRGGTIATSRLCGNCACPAQPARVSTFIIRRRKSID
jgi:cysteine desulfurase/selenocysteine lyase